MRIKRPKQFPVGGHIYEVRQASSLGVRKHVLAEVNSVDQIATIDSGLLESRKTQTLFHEVLEGINFVWLDGGLPHNQLDAISEGFFQFFASLGIELDWSD